MKATHSRAPITAPTIAASFTSGQPDLTSSLTLTALSFGLQNMNINKMVVEQCEKMLKIYRESIEHFKMYRRKIIYV